MDFQRIFILLGLAVTAYMLVLAWNEDYGQGATAPATVDESPALPVPPLDATIPGSVPTVQDSTVPELATGAVPIPQTVPNTAAATRQLITVETDVFNIQIDPLGGDIVKVSLPDFPASLETPDVPFVLLDPRNAYVGQSGLIGPNGTDKKGVRPLFQSDLQNYDMGSHSELNVSLSHIQSDGTSIRKTYRFKQGDYLIGLEYEVTNAAETPWVGGLFTQIKRDGQDPISQSSNLMGMQPFVGGATRSDQEFYKKLEFEDLEEEPYKLTRPEGYMAMVQHYFVSAWVPQGDSEVSYQARKLRNQDVYLFGFTTPAISIPPGETGVLAASFYSGPKDQYRLQEIATGLDLVVDYGFLWWMAQPLFWMLTVIHGMVGNWGLAIIGLTIIVKILLYPLSAASFRSMAKMRKLQPEMMRLKERYGDDQQKFSQEMMNLYKKEGANPLGGCFPILLQMPVFLALYWTLMESVELRQAPFFLWIEDLSAMDPFFILPILMGVSMYLTQRMQPEPPDPVQARVFKFMPIMFTFFFLWFPSGLVLYWLVNNILSIMQQWYVTRQIEKASG
ncbi:MAG: membrane protein insertase YidC [Pseudomonadales bacterium]|jgi:YidC/Oxa1 family membrane protein insertase|nr:membrane protein insertase YidC [Pseudomonadales bacterium]